MCEHSAAPAFLQVANGDGGRLPAVVPASKGADQGGMMGCRVVEELDMVHGPSIPRPERAASNRRPFNSTEATVTPMPYLGLRAAVQMARLATDATLEIQPARRRNGTDPISG